jgi:hypothetical protein
MNLPQTWRLAIALALLGQVGSALEIEREGALNNVIPSTFSTYAPPAPTGGGRLALFTKSNTTYLLWDSVDPATRYYELWGCVLATVAPPACSPNAANPQQLQIYALTSGNHAALFPGLKGESNVGAPAFSPDGSQLSLSVANPSMVGNEPYLCTPRSSVPGQGCGNDAWTCPITLTTGSNPIALGVCTNRTNIPPPNPGSQQPYPYGVLYTTFGQGASGPSSGYWGLALRYAVCGTGTALGPCNNNNYLGCFSPGVYSWSSPGNYKLLNAGANAKGAKGQYSPEPVSSAQPCPAIEASGFFYTPPKNPHYPLFCFDSNFDGQNPWNWEAYCWAFPTAENQNYSLGTPTALLTWGTNGGLLDDEPCGDWNEHFHPNATFTNLVFYSSHQNLTEYNGAPSTGATWGCDTTLGYPGSAQTPPVAPLDAWSLGLTYSFSAETNPAGTLTTSGTAERLTNVNVPNSADNIQVCGASCPQSYPDGSYFPFGGGDSAWGPNSTYFTLVNTAGAGANNQGAIFSMTLEQVKGP